MLRRGFLKFALGGITGAVASPMIWTSMYDVAYWTQNWGWIPRLKPGANEYIPTVSKICPGGTPILVRLVDGRVIRTLGNPDNNISDGGLPPLAASEGQLLYAESRVKTPLLRGPDGGYRVISWAKANAILLEKSKTAKGSTAFLSGDAHSTLNELFSAFIREQGSSDFFSVPREDYAAQKAWSLMGGKGQIAYDFDKSDYILSIGANMLENWGTVARNRKIFKQSHSSNPDTKPSMTLAYASSIQNNTAVVADLWLPVKPATETIFALGICHELIKKGYGSHLPNIDEFTSFVAPYSLDVLKTECGVLQERFESLIDGLTNAKRPIVVSGCPLAIGSGATPIMATIAVNMLLGRVGFEGNLLDLPIAQKVLPKALSHEEIQSNELVTFSQEIAEGKRRAPKLLFLYEANPIYALPKNVKMKECFDAIDFKVSFASFWDETSAQCDLVLPSALGLERFDDVYTPYASGFINWTIAKPVSTPRHEALPVGEVIIALAEELGYDLGVPDVPTLLKIKGDSIGANFKEYLQNGQTYQLPNKYAALNLNFALPILKEALGTVLSSGFRIVPLVSCGIGTPNTGIPPYANRIIADYQLEHNLAVVQMNSKTAHDLNVVSQEKITLETSNGTISASVGIFEGIMNDVLSITAGLGHTEFDRFSINKGENILNLTHVYKEAGTGLPIFSDSGVKVVKG